MSWAVCMDDKMTYNLLIRYGADPNLQDTFGNMILHVVVARERLVEYQELNICFPLSLSFSLSSSLINSLNESSWSCDDFSVCIELQIYSIIPFIEWMKEEEEESSSLDPFSLMSFLLLWWNCNEVIQQGILWQVKKERKTKLIKGRNWNLLRIKRIRWWWLDHRRDIILNSSQFTLFCFVHHVKLYLTESSSQVSPGLVFEREEVEAGTETNC